MKRSSQLNRQGGFTLIELVVTIAIASIAMSLIAGIFTILLKSYNQSTNIADAQNLATLSVRKVEQEVRVCTSLKIYDTKVDSASGTPIYFDDSKHGINIGDGTYLADTFDKYDCTLKFTGCNTNILGVSVTIKDKSGKTLSSIESSVYLENKPKIDGTDGGGFIVFS